jgi:hypothetical protein
MLVGGSEHLVEMIQIWLFYQRLSGRESFGTSQLTDILPTVVPSIWNVTIPTDFHMFQDG